jgi:hypothetical protein
VVRMAPQWKTLENLSVVRMAPQWKTLENLGAAPVQTLVQCKTLKVG